MSRRVAVVFPFPLERAHLSKDVFLIPQGLAACGVDVELHCPRAEPDVAWPAPVLVAGDRFADPRWYADRSLDGAVVFSFLHYARLLAAVGATGLRVVAKGDTTGFSVVRAHPGRTLRHARFDHPTRRGRAKALAEWAVRLGPLAGRDARALQRALRLAAVTVVETRPALEAVQRSLRLAGATDLVARLRVVPNPISEAFTAAPVSSGAREKLVVATGRWDLAAKNAPLLADALARFLRRRPDYRAVVVGSGGAGVFGPAVTRIGHTSQAAIADLLGRSRTIVTSSHWESFSLSSHEALAMGCSVVGTPIPPVVDIASSGPQGTVAAGWSAAALAAALADEARAWDAGLRDPEAIAAACRERVDVGTVGREYAALLDV